MRLPAWLILWIVLISLACPSPTGVQAARGCPTASPDHITLTCTGNPATTMTITWRTDAAVTTGFVQSQEGAQVSPTARRDIAASTPFNTDLGSSRLFTATLTGLSPNTRYAYRIGDGERWSTTRTFMTAGPESRDLKFLVFGDSQSPPGGISPYSTWRATVHNAYRANPDARFMVMTGDLVDVGQSGTHWNGWFGAAEGVIDTIPVLPAVGNHETTGSSDTRRPFYWNAQFRLPPNGPEGLKNQVYSFDYGPVHLVVLDSQQSEEKRRGMLRTQRDWLEADLAASDATWKIVFFHKPPYSVKRGRDNKDIRSAFCPVFERHGVDLVLSGHDHAVGRTRPINGVVYYMVGRSGTKTYRDVSKRDPYEFFCQPRRQPNYVVVEVAGPKLTIKAVRLDGTVIDAFTMEKPQDPSRNG